MKKFIIQAWLNMCKNLVLEDLLFMHIQTSLHEIFHIMEMQFIILYIVYPSLFAYAKYGHR